MADKTFSQTVTDYISKIANPAAAAKFNQLSNEYQKEVEHCHNTHFEQQENLNMSNRATGVKRTIAIEPKLSAIENAYREKAQQLASDLGHREQDHELEPQLQPAQQEQQPRQQEQQSEQQVANDNEDRFNDNKIMTAQEEREQQRQEYLQRRRQWEQEKEQQRGQERERD